MLDRRLFLTALLSMPFLFVEAANAVAGNRDDDADEDGDEDSDEDEIEIEDDDRRRLRR